MAQYTPTLYLNEVPVELQLLYMDVFPINQGESASYKFDIYLGAFIDSETPEIWISFDPEYYDYYVVDAFSSDAEGLRYVPCEIKVENKLQPITCYSENHYVKIQLAEALETSSELLSSILEINLFGVINPVVGVAEFTVLVIDPISRVVDIWGKVEFTFTDPVPALLDILDVVASSEFLDVESNYNITFEIAKQ